MHASIPYNPVTGTVYSGGNRETLQLAQRSQGYSSPRWYTYLNARDIGRPVRRGQKATPIHSRFGRCFSVFNEDQLVSGSSPGHASLACVDLETDDCGEWSIVPKDDRFSLRQSQQVVQALRLLRQYLRQC